jgi:hypothetical protein
MSCREKGVVEQRGAIMGLSRFMRKKIGKNSPSKILIKKRLKEKSILYSRGEPRHNNPILHFAIIADMENESR